MLKKLLAWLGIGATASDTASDLHEPYTEAHTNLLYNLLFCDDIELFKNPDDVEGEGLWPTLLAASPDPEALRSIADDPTNEGRVRALAFNRLRAAGQPVLSKELLGVIVEVAFDDGLDTLAAFSEGGVRYLDKSGKVVVFEGAGHPVEALARELVAVSRRVVSQIGPWEKQRLPPPAPGKVRTTFLVSDGLYFGEGALRALQNDPMGGPVLAKATELLQRAVAIGTR